MRRWLFQVTPPAYKTMRGYKALTDYKETPQPMDGYKNIATDCQSDEQNAEQKE